MEKLEMKEGERDMIWITMVAGGDVMRKLNSMSAVFVGKLIEENEKARASEGLEE